MGVRLTEKKLEDSRFRRREEAIFRVFFDEGDGKNCSVGYLIRKVGIDKATVYRHHKSVCEIISDYEQYILVKFNKVLAGVKSREEMQLKQIYYQMLIFIFRHRKIFGVLIKKKGTLVVEMMMLELKTKIMKDCKIINNSERIFRVYAGEVAVLIREWGLSGFNELEIGVLLGNIMYLTTTVRVKLAPIVE